MPARKFKAGDIVEFKREPIDTQEGFLVVDGVDTGRILRQDYGDEIIPTTEIVLVSLQNGYCHSANQTQLRLSKGNWCN